MSEQLLLKDELDGLERIRFLVLDVETTGTSPQAAEITEVAAVLVQGGRILARYDSLVAIRGQIPPYISTLTGIYPQMLTDAPELGEVLLALSEMAEGAVLVGHNLRFDLSFINAGLGSISGLLPLENKTLDTLGLSRKLLVGEVPDFKLGTLARELRLSHQPTHRAMADVLATVDLLHLLIERASGFGVANLAELRSMPGRLSQAHGSKLRACNFLPRRPGIYWMETADGEVTYVGKAVDINARYRSYFTSDSRPKVDSVLTGATHVGYITFASELEALIAEARLIRRLRPRHNRMLNKGENGYRALAVSEDKKGGFGIRLANAASAGRVSERRLGPFRSRRSAQSAEHALRCALLPELHPDWPDKGAGSPTGANSPWGLPVKAWSERIWERMCALATTANFEEAERLRAGAHFLFLAISRQLATLLLEGVEEMEIDTGTGGSPLRAAHGSLHLAPLAMDRVPLSATCARSMESGVSFELIMPESFTHAESDLWLPRLDAFEERWILWKQLTNDPGLRLSTSSSDISLPLTAGHHSFVPRATAPLG